MVLLRITGRLNKALDSLWSQFLQVNPEFTGIFIRRLCSTYSTLKVLYDVSMAFKTENLQYAMFITLVLSMFKIVSIGPDILGHY